MTKRFDRKIRFVETDLFQLVGAQRSAAFDALVRGDVLPFVIIEDEIVCTGGLNSDVIAAAIERFVTGVMASGRSRE